MSRLTHPAAVLVCALALAACLGGQPPEQSTGPGLGDVDYPPGFGNDTVDPAGLTAATADAGAYVLTHRTDHSIRLPNGSTHRIAYTTTYRANATAGELSVHEEAPGGPEERYWNRSFGDWTPTYRVESDDVALSMGGPAVGDRADPPIDKSSNLSTVLGWFRWNATGVASTGAGGNATLIRYRATGFTDAAIERSPLTHAAGDVAFFGASLRAYRDVNASLVVDTDGRLHRFAFRADRQRFRGGDVGTMRTSLDVEYPASLDVERPDWVDRADELAD